jgi:hypothetical protein
MAELFVRTTLPDLSETVPFEQLHDLARFEDGNRPHESGNLDLPDADEFGFQLRLSVFEEHLQNLS